MKAVPFRLANHFLQAALHRFHKCNAAWLDVFDVLDERIMWHTLKSTDMHVRTTCWSYDWGIIYFWYFLLFILFLANLSYLWGFSGPSRYDGRVLLSLTTTFFKRRKLDISLANLLWTFRILVTYMWTMHAACENMVNVYISGFSGRLLANHFLQAPRAWCRLTNELHLWKPVQCHLKEVVGKAKGHCLHISRDMYPTTYITTYMYAQNMCMPCDICEICTLYMSKLCDNYDNICITGACQMICPIVLTTVHPQLSEPSFSQSSLAAEVT